MRRLLLLTLVAAGALVPIGCGGGSSSSGNPQSDVRATIADLTSASKAGDGAKICDEIFTAPLKDSVASASKRTCAAEVTAKLFSAKASFQVEQVAVSGNTATVKVKDQFGKVSLVSLVKQNGKWRIAGVTAAS